MPFLVRPPPESAAADDPSLTYTVIEPDPGDRAILRDLKIWGWRVTRLDFSDEEFIDALKTVEKDAKRRRRQTHAVAGEVLGYYGRPSLDELWVTEAEKMLEGSAYVIEIDGPKFANAAENDEDVRYQEAMKAWLQCIDRTRQMNGLLDYNDPGREIPRLVTRGLDHHLVEASYEPAYAVYGDLKRVHGQPPLGPGDACTKSKCVSRYIQRSKNTLQRLNQPQAGKFDLSSTGIVPGAPFAWTMYSQLHAYSRPYSQTRTQPQPQPQPQAQPHTKRPKKPEYLSNTAAATVSAFLDNPLSQAHGYLPHTLPKDPRPLSPPSLQNKPLPNLPSHQPPPPSDTFDTDLDYPLIFPGDISSTRTYIRHTRPGIKSPIHPSILAQSSRAAPSLHRPGLGPDPYGWDEWDRRTQRDREFKASLKFCVARKRRGMSSRARPRGKEEASRVRVGNKHGAVDVRLREIAREMDEIVGRME